MTSARLAPLLLLAALLACGGDDAPAPASSGGAGAQAVGGSAGRGGQGASAAGGAAGTGAGQGAGTSGAAGTQAAAGAAGSSGAGGAAGAAGSGLAGSAGNANVGGQSPAGNAGTSGSGGGQGGAGGTAPVVCPQPAPPPGTGVWRSKLFPKDWKPVHAGGKRDAAGLALPDFSYAGYHRGEVPVPYGKRAVVATVSKDLGDNKMDATPGIQAAIDEACKAGGGAVVIPAGTYRLKMPATPLTNAAVLIPCSHLTLRGEGPDKTKLVFDDPTKLRQRAVIRVSKAGSLEEPDGATTYALAQDALETTRTLELVSVGTLAVGQRIVVRNDNTPGFRADHRMDKAKSGLEGLWLPTSFLGIFYARTITAIAGNTVTLDAPTQYPLKTRDQARVYALPSSLEEVGIEGLGLGMVASKAKSTAGTEDKSDDDYDEAGTLGYEVHASQLINFAGVHDSWLHDVSTFEAPGNPAGIHVLSLGVNLGSAAFRITVHDVAIGRPQYRGGGGNGYAFQVGGSDNLIVDSSTYAARHGITTSLAVSGNVFSHLRFRKSRLSTDTHRYLAHANLFERIELEDTWLQSVNRGLTSGGAGFTGTRNAFWATQITGGNDPRAKTCAVESAQLADGYLIGSKSLTAGVGADLCTESFTNAGWAKLDSGAPKDWAEGENKGDKLDPQSLWAAQKALRFTREGLACEE